MLINLNLHLTSYLFFQICSKLYKKTDTKKQPPSPTIVIFDFKRQLVVNSNACADIFPRCWSNGIKKCQKCHNCRLYLRPLSLCQDHDFRHMFLRKTCLEFSHLSLLYAFHRLYFWNSIFLKKFLNSGRRILSSVCQNICQILVFFHPSSTSFSPLYKTWKQVVA